MHVETKSTLEITIHPDNTIEGIIFVNLSLTNKSLRLSLQQDGKVHTAYVPSISVTPVDYINQTSEERLVELMDAYGVLFNTIDGNFIVDYCNTEVQRQAENSEIDEETAKNLAGRIQSMGSVNSTMVLYNMFSDLMGTIFGPNWIALRTPEFVGKSLAYQALRRRVKVLKEAIATLVG